MGLRPQLRLVRCDARRLPIAGGSVHCVVTSPPYYGLRKYAGVPETVWGGDPEHAHEWGEMERGKKGDRNPAETDAGNDNLGKREFAQGGAPLDAGRFCTCGAWRGCLGNEPTPDLYVAHMVECFREVRRVLRDDGVCWLNLGDSFSTTPPGNVRGVGETSGLHGAATSTAYRETLMAGHGQGAQRKQGGIPAGNLLGIPWLVAFALRDDGWVLREDVVWSKVAPMPESVSGWRWERCRVKVASKDMAAVSPQKSDTAHEAPQKGLAGHSGGAGVYIPAATWADCLGCAKCEANTVECESCEGTGVERGAFRAALAYDLAVTDEEHRVWASTNPCPSCGGRGKIGLVLRRGSWRHTRAHEFVFMIVKSMAYFCDAEAVKEPASTNSHGGGQAHESRYMQASGRSDGTSAMGILTVTRNPRSVMHLGPEPFGGGHFAVFPSRLIEPLILAATSAKGCCPKCGAQWARVVERKAMEVRPSERRAEAEAAGLGGGRTATSGTMTSPPESRTLDWRPTCTCNAGDPVPCVVLDPFAGSGTTGRVALEQGRSAILCELSMGYVAGLATGRTTKVQLPLCS